MEVGLIDLFGILMIYFGLKVIIVGKVDVEAGVTNGAEYNAKFIKSSKSSLTGNHAKAVGIGFCFIGILMIWLIPNKNILFSIPYL
ncbi:hypothetical protein OE749_07250 [Aestuariibacter sp. AA17]|uniref:Uncharacterized protein n=1 Tax=Fluctibacter corallii TaxID=2984329 RepID=A0ABT3A724_9ALTE|nr:hypothetical protein [Aestuariibacter sp. AA17]MCV2884485.1 hypothetical protein [Aestuariibacter sp. AA17]